MQDYYQDYTFPLPTYSSDPSSGRGGGRRGTGVDWIMVVVVEPYKRKMSRSRSSCSLYCQHPPL